MNPLLVYAAIVVGIFQYLIIGMLVADGLELYRPTHRRLTTFLWPFLTFVMMVGFPLMLIQIFWATRGDWTWRLKTLLDSKKHRLVEKIWSLWR